MKYIYVKDKLLLTAVDGENDDGCDSPEDMIWRREISSIFYAGVEAGRTTKDDSEIEVLDQEK
ncbi:MAG: hypothetical protein PHF74_05700 [Dehalococcoidales bacterium]|nr:hypothetical protein [Dehalococcoidales bacterium]